MSDKTNDELLKELNAIPEPKKKKKKKKKGKNQPKEEEEKKEEPVKEDKKEEPKEEKKEESAKEEKKEEPVKDEGEEEKKEEEEDEEKKDEVENEEKTNETKKKKKVVKKVVKKKGKGKMSKNEAMLIQMAKLQKQKQKEEEERLIKEAAERERKEKEEEERRKKEEEEQRKKEEEIKKQEEERKKKLKELNIKESEYEKLEEKKKKTEEMLKKQGTNLDELLESLKDVKHKKKKKKTKAKEEVKKPEEKQENEIKEEDKDENEIKEENKNKNENNEEEEDKDDDVNDVEVGEKVFVAEGNEDIDNWEDELDDNQEKKDDVNKKENKSEEEEEMPKKEEEKKEEKKEEKEEKKEAKKIKKKKGKNKEKENEEEKDKEKDGKVSIKEIRDNARLRAPIVCVLGHVDAGKTKILDKLRHSNVQLGEAGGITQQIGATFIPMENIQSHISKIDERFHTKTRIPGILLIDTPGHASFTNLRSRGSSLCDIAVLILNIDKGIEKQSVESLDLLRMRKTPFIIALNQIDRTYNWRRFDWSGFEDSYRKQKDQQKRLFDEKVEQNKMQFIKNNINAELYYKNTNMKEYVNMVPTSAITGEGLPDLLGLLVYLTDNYLIRQITYKEEVKCSILEVKVLETIGTTIDVVLVNGTIHVGDKIVIGGLLGPIKTVVKIILLPKPMKEMRVKCEYERYDEISGAIGVKIFCPDLENALAGSPLYVYKTEEEAEHYCNEISKDFNSIVQKYLNKKGKGIMVQASTLGSLEAILTFLNEQKVEVAVVGVGNLNKKDVIKLQIKHAEDENVMKEDLVILCFDNKVLPEAQKVADENGIKIFVDDIIYHLFDKFIEFKNKSILERKKEKEKEAIFPCSLKTVMFINKKDPLIIGVSVTEGVLKIGTPIYCVEKNLPLGVVESIEREKKPINNVRPNDGDVAIRIKVADSSLAAGRHFDESSTYVSQITRNSINALKNYFREDMTTDDWKLVIKLKKILNIQ
jgi:translation initiation factor 5B